MDFSSLQLVQPLLDAVRDEGYSTPTPIQAQAIPPGMEGRDVFGCAQTGTGKTAAFVLPILHRLLSMPADKARRGKVLPRALVLCPTRELATQIAQSFAAFGRHTHLTYTTIFGGVGQAHQVRALRQGVDIVVATPGRLIDLMEQREANLSEVTTFVLDEADRMLDMGFITPIRRIASVLPSPRQTLMFSATMPREIMQLADSLLRDPVKVSVAKTASTAPQIEQSVYMVPRQSKSALLKHLLSEHRITRAVVFTRTKHGADKLCRALDASGISAGAIHGNKAQNQRERALAAFRSGKSRVLVATDVAARGLDVDGITHVFNYDLPDEPEAYVHRIGRTGRAGAAGTAISFCDHENSDDRDSLRAIERLTGKRVPTITKLPALPEPAPMPTMPFAGEDRPKGSPHHPRRNQTGGGFGGGFGGEGSRSGGPRRGARRGNGPKGLTNRPKQTEGGGTPTHGPQEAGTPHGGSSHRSAHAPDKPGSHGPAHSPLARHTKRRRSW